MLPSYNRSLPDPQYGQIQAYSFSRKLLCRSFLARTYLGYRQSRLLLVPLATDHLPSDNEQLITFFKCAVEFFCCQLYTLLFINSKLFFSKKVKQLKFSLRQFFLNVTFFFGTKFSHQLQKLTGILLLFSSMKTSGKPLIKMIKSGLCQCVSHLIHI